MGTCVSSNSISPNTFIKVPRQSTINFKSIKNDIIDRDEPQERLNDSLRVKSTNNRGILKKNGKFNKHSRNLDLYKNCRNLTPRNKVQWDIQERRSPNDNTRPSSVTSHFNKPGISIKPTQDPNQVSIKLEQYFICYSSESDQGIVAYDRITSQKSNQRFQKNSIGYNSQQLNAKSIKEEDYISI